MQKASFLFGERAFFANKNLLGTVLPAADILLGLYRSFRFFAVLRFGILCTRYNLLKKMQYPFSFRLLCAIMLNRILYTPEPGDFEKRQRKKDGKIYRRRVRLRRYRRRTRGYRGGSRLRKARSENGYVHNKPRRRRKYAVQSVDRRHGKRTPCA